MEAPNCFQSDADMSDDNNSDDASDVDSVTASQDKHHGCNVTNGDVWKGFATLMTKIDVTYGAWGLYNYYRMEVTLNFFYIFQY
jgi:hypothetical protein